jgi:hypothetical protein
MDNKPMPDPLDFDPIKIHYNAECAEAEFLWNLIKIKGAKPIVRFYPHTRPAITTEKITIEPLSLAIEYLDTRFAQNRVLPLNPSERAAMQMLVADATKTTKLYALNPFILGRECSLADLAYATTTHNADYLKLTICNLTSNR